jgi:hypothetical protein
MIIASLLSAMAQDLEWYIYMQGCLNSRILIRSGFSRAKLRSKIEALDKFYNPFGGHWEQFINI